jgi:hypothetical protein
MLQTASMFISSNSHLPLALIQCQTNVQQLSGAGGVCSGKCGFFLEGRGCRATYKEFEEAYHTIRNVNNCLTCGYAFKPRTHGMFST